MLYVPFETVITSLSDATSIASSKDVPYPSTLVFNPGVVKYQGKYIMLFRNDYFFTKEECETYSRGDVEHPTVSKGIGLSEEPLIAPEATYEIKDGFRNNVIFPCGVIMEKSGEVKIYYGAADTVICLATADIDDLLNLCS